MKWFTSLERKIFPNDSPYQRIRRRRAIAFGACISIVLIWMTAKVVLAASGYEGKGVHTRSIWQFTPPKRAK
jgi:hypothetical protein